MGHHIRSTKYTWCRKTTFFYQSGHSQLRHLTAEVMSICWWSDTIRSNGLSQCYQKSLTINVLFVTLRVHTRLLHVHQSWHGALRGHPSVTAEPLIALRIVRCRTVPPADKLWRLEKVLLTLILDLSVLTKFNVLKFCGSGKGFSRQRVQCSPSVTAEPLVYDHLLWRHGQPAAS